MTEFDQDKVRQYLDAEVQRRFDAATQAGRVAEEAASLQARADAAAEQFDAAWKAAVTAGWSERELTRMGLSKPKPQRRVSSGKKRSNAPRSTKPPASEPDATGIGHHDNG